MHKKPLAMVAVLVMGFIPFLHMHVQGQSYQTIQIFNGNLELQPLQGKLYRFIIPDNATNKVGLIQVAAFVAMIFILTNYFQQVLGYSALSAGVAFAPMGVVFLVVSGFLSARLVNRFGVKPIIISGMVLQTIAYLSLSPISLTDSYFGSDPCSS